MSGDERHARHQVTREAVQRTDIDRRMTTGLGEVRDPDPTPEIA